MEVIDECLFNSNIEISCWRDQHKQVVSQSYIITTILNRFHFRIKSILFKMLFQLLLNLYFFVFFFRGLLKTILMPLQASSFLIKAYQRRVALDPPLPPITCEQILHGELASLLKEENYI